MPLSIDRFRREFARTVVARLLVRFHMAPIFAGTVSAGMVVSKAAPGAPRLAACHGAPDDRAVRLRRGHRVDRRLVAAACVPERRDAARRN
jgi:hypothetical protein